MDWDEALREKVLGDNSEGLLKAFLLTELPQFELPTDARAWQRRRTPAARRTTLSDRCPRNGGQPAKRPLAHDDRHGGAPGSSANRWRRF